MSIIGFLKHCLQIITLLLSNPTSDAVAVAIESRLGYNALQKMWKMNKCAEDI